MGEFVLKPSNGKRTEICFVLVSSSRPGTPVFDNLSNIRFTLSRGVKAWSGEADGVQQEKAKEDPVSDKKKTSQKAGQAAAAAAKPAGADSSGTKGNPGQRGLHPVYDREWVSHDSLLDDWEATVSEQQIHKNLAKTAAMRQVEKDAYRTAANKVMADKAKESMFVGKKSPEQAKREQWDRLHEQYLWPKGQGPVMESMFSPYESEGISTCAKCQPGL